MTATIIEAPDCGQSGVVRFSDHGQRTVIKNLMPAKLKPRRGEDLQVVVYEKPVEGLGFKKDEAFEDAIEKARAQVTHDLGLTVPVSGEFVRERLKANQHEEVIKDFIKGEPAYRTTLDLKMTRGSYLELAEAERGFRVNERMEGVARVLSVVVISEDEKQRADDQKRRAENPSRMTADPPLTSMLPIATTPPTL